jgi:hypothetical protein
VLRQLSHTTSRGNGQKPLGFEDILITAVQEDEDNGAGKVQIIIPPLVFGR